MQCSKCGGDLHDGWAVCPICKTEVPQGPQGPRPCPNRECGETVQANWTVCPVCRTSLSGGASVEELPAKAVGIGWSELWGSVASRWHAFWKRLQPSKEMKKALRNAMRAIGILVVMVALFILTGGALALLSQEFAQPEAFLAFVSVLSTLVALGFTWELLDDWTWPLLIGAILLVGQMVVGMTLLADEWALQAALSAALVLGAYLARRLFLGNQLQEYYDRGKEAGRLSEIWRRNEELAAEVAAGDGVPPAAVEGDDESEFEIAPFPLYDEEV